MQTPIINKALFLDRDGVINEDSAYPHRPDQIVFKEGIFELCKAAKSAGYLLVVVSNQAGVAKGKFTSADVEHLHDWMKNEFAVRGIRIEKFYFCPYHEKGIIPEYTRKSDHRKPGPGMLLDAAEEFSIDLSRSIMVGDKESDRISIAGLRSIILKSPYTPTGWDVEHLRDVTNHLHAD